jgi:hypothetical protein
MSVKITNFDTWAYVHDDAPGGSHGGVLDPTSITYGTNTDGTDDLNIIVVPCPFEGCGAVSYWPPGGGADALLGQSLHVVKQYQASVAAARGAVAMSVIDAAEQVKQRVIATDGEERWVLDDAAMALLEARLTGA